MKILLLEPDIDFSMRIIQGLNSTRTNFEVVHFKTLEEVYAYSDFYYTFNLFVLNLKNPINIKAEQFIRNNGGYDTPILLLLDKELVSFDLFRTLHYLDRYHDITIKDNIIEPVIHRIFKLCNIWNDDVFFISKNIYFDYQKLFFIYNELKIHFGKKEALLLKLLFVKSPQYVSYNEIAHFVYQDDLISNERIRALIRLIRRKLPTNIIESNKYFGYRILEHNL